MEIITHQSLTARRHKAATILARLKSDNQMLIEALQECTDLNKKAKIDIDLMYNKLVSLIGRESTDALFGSNDNSDQVA